MFFPILLMCCCAIAVCVLGVLCIQDIYRRRVSRAYIRIVLLAVGVMAVSYGNIYPLIICGVSAMFIYAIGWKCGQIGIGDVKLSPAISILGVIVSSWLAPDRLAYSTSYLTVYYCIHTLVWIMLAQLITVCALLVRRLVFRISLATPIAHCPCMCLGIIGVSLMRTWNVF